MTMIVHKYIITTESIPEQENVPNPLGGRDVNPDHERNEQKVPHFQDAFLAVPSGEPTIGANLTDRDGLHGRFAGAAAEEAELANGPRVMFNAERRRAFFMGDFISATACLAETLLPPFFGESCGI